jgi:hypothetical protein
MMSGYPGQTGPTWPSIDHNDKELRIDKHATKKIIDDLKNNDLNKYVTQHGKSGLPDDLTNAGSRIKPTDVGAGGGDSKTSYPAGEKIWEMIQKVNNPTSGFPALYSQFVTAYGDMINALYLNAGFYDDADENSKLPTGTGNQNSGGNQSFNSGQQQS